MTKSRYALGSINVAVLLTFAGLAAGCGSAAPSPDGRPLSLGVPASLAMDSASSIRLPELPAPSAISHGASVIESGLVLNGASFRDDLTHQHVSVAGDDCIFDPAFLSGDQPQFDQVALAIYSFDISLVSDEVLVVSDLSLDGRLDLVIGTARVFAGVPSLSLQTWEWTELTKKTSPDGGSNENWSFGDQNIGSFRARAPQGALHVCIVVFGDTALHVSRVALAPPADAPGSPPPPLLELFRKGWDGTIKGRTTFDQSVSVCVDDSSTVHCSYYDSSNGQLFHLRVDDRVVTTQAVDCDVDSGLTNDLLCAPNGRLFLSYWQDEDGDDFGTGRLREIVPTKLEWPNLVSFDDGDDGSGLPPADVGQRSSLVWDSQADLPCIFYEDRSSHRIKLARATSSSATDWLTDFVSPSGGQATSPVALACDDGVCCLYIDDEDGDSSTDNRLMLARFDATGWSSVVVADDVHNPDPTDDDCDGFCDASVFGDLLVSCYSSSSGFKVAVHDMSKSIIQNIRARVADPSPSSGAFCDMEMLGDGSVRIAHYNTFDTTLYMMYSGVVSNPDFTCTSVPLFLFGGDRDCNDLEFYLDPDDDGDGWSEAVVVTLISSFSALTQSRHHELTGHVTLIK